MIFFIFFSIFVPNKPYFFNEDTTNVILRAKNNLNIIYKPKFIFT